MYTFILYFNQTKNWLLKTKSARRSPVALSPASAIGPRWTRRSRSRDSTPETRVASRANSANGCRRADELFTTLREEFLTELFSSFQTHNLKKTIKKKLKVENHGG